MLATFLGFWAAAAVWELALLGFLVLACVFSSAGVLWRWEKGNEGDPGWAYTWFIAIFLVVGAATIPEGSFWTLQGFIGGVTTTAKYLLEYLAAGLVYALCLLVWTFIRGRQALQELVTGLIDYKPLLSKPNSGTLRSYAEIQDKSNDSTLFAKYFFGYNAFFKLEEGYDVIEARPENVFKLKVKDVSVLKANVLCAFLNNMFLWAALLPARIFKDWLIDFGRWIVETVSKFGLNYVRSALKA